MLTKNSSSISTRFYHIKTTNSTLEQKIGLCELAVKFCFGNWSPMDPHQKLFYSILKRAQIVTLLQRKEYRLIRSKNITYYILFSHSSKDLGGSSNSQLNKKKITNFLKQVVFGWLSIRTSRSTNRSLLVAVQLLTQKPKVLLYPQSMVGNGVQVECKNSLDIEVF